MAIEKRHIAILGAGESGVGTALLAKKQGWNAFVSDSGKIAAKYLAVLKDNQIDFEQGSHDTTRILKADLIVKSPGIPDKVALIQESIQAGIPVISEIEFAFRYNTAKLIAITGSNGKTTTTSLVHHILTKAGLKVGLGGNIGESFAKIVANNDYDWIVLELSSFQLDGIVDFRPDIAILLNITPDHLDRYDYQMEKYINSKFRITKNLKSHDWFIYFADDPNILKKMQEVSFACHLAPFTMHDNSESAGFIKNNKQLIINIKNQFTMSIHELALKGKHNTQNSLAAGIAARVLEIRKDIVRESLSDFVNVEHRLEFVAKVHGIEFINDSKATNINSTWFALESMDKPTVWIVGGVDKGNDYSELFDLVNEKVKAIICLGLDNSKIIEAFGPMSEQIFETKSADEAVALAYRLAKKDETVLLSPACASFDLFENYEERGKEFKKAVRAL